MLVPCFVMHDVIDDGPSVETGTIAPRTMEKEGGHLSTFSFTGTHEDNDLYEPFNAPFTMDCRSGCAVVV